LDSQCPAVTLVNGTKAAFYHLHQPPTHPPTIAKEHSHSQLFTTTQQMYRAPPSLLDKIEMVHCRFPHTLTSLCSPHFFTTQMFLAMLLSSILCNCEWASKTRHSMFSFAFVICRNIAALPTPPHSHHSCGHPALGDTPASGVPDHLDHLARLSDQVSCEDHLGEVHRWAAPGRLSQWEGSAARPVGPLHPSPTFSVRLAWILGLRSSLCPAETLSLSSSK
jgi:hypothetical protein